ncbi:MAG: hypothetical protein RL106_1324, partial [Bacteroidota bacterium]
MKSFFSAIVFLISTQVLWAQPAGSLDTSFGNAGKVVTSFSSSIEEAKAVFLQSDGKILIAGYAQLSATGKDFLVARYLENGTLDSGFGDNGKTIIDVQLGSDDIAHSMIVDAVGRIILAGSSDDGVNKNAAMIRLDASGIIDVSFGTNGKVLTDFVGGQQDEVKVIKQHALTGKLILGGQSASTSNIALPIIARYNEDGAIDSTFNATGILAPTVSAGDLQRSIMVEDLEVAANGKISAAGWRKLVSTSISSEFWTCRVLTNGTLDNTFSTDGVLAYSETGGSYYAYSLDLNANQDMIIAGTRSYLGSNDFRILTISNLGTISNTSSNYYVSTDIDVSYAMTRDMEGKYVLAGSAGTLTSKNFGTLRLLAPGDLQADYDFDSDGRVQTNFNGNLLNECWDVVVQNDNKIVCVGYSGNDIALCRYLGNGLPQLDVFNLSSPANNSANQNFATIDLTWTEAYGASVYEVEVSTDISFNTIVASGQVATAAASVTNLLPATSYWWRVRAGDGTNWGTFVGPWKFTTIGLTSFSLSMPMNNANNVAYASVNFNWTDNLGATGYQMMLGTDVDFAISQVTFNTTTSAKTVTNLLPGTTYYWKVRATNDGSNYGAWVGPWAFNTQDAPNGVTELNQVSFAVYPNPSIDVITVKGSLIAGQLIAIYNQQGQIVHLHLTTSEGNQVISVAGLSSGMYFLKVGNEVVTFVK